MPLELLLNVIGSITHPEKVSGDMLANTESMTVTVTEAFAVGHIPSLTATVYVLSTPGDTIIEAEVSPVFQR
jgi:hypothetical protein